MVLGAVCLRRLKTHSVLGKPIISLPTKKIFNVLIKLTGREKALYASLELSGKQQFQQLLASHELMNHYAFVLEILLRMRQCCDHALLVPKKYAQHGFRIATDARKRLATLYEEGNEDERCTKCEQHIERELKYLAPCAHFFCYDCLWASQLCGVCGVAIKHEEAVGPDMVKMVGVSKELANADRSRFELSSKLESLLGLFVKYDRNEPGWKAVVFSQWTGFLDLCERALEAQRIGHTRLDGQMSAQKRKDALATFKCEPHVKVFLISLKAGGVGLNLTSANKVILVDPWWNPATEEQAIDRIHRIGQQKPVEVIRMVCENTVEQNILALQDKKRKLIENALDYKQQDRLSDLKELFR
jgi:SNF2 family DNA or RNA helicase